MIVTFKENSGNCRALKFTRELVFGPVASPQAGGPPNGFVIVVQNSNLCVGDVVDDPCSGTDAQIGTVYATATILGDARIGQGGYNFTSGDYGVGAILFESVIVNAVVPSDLKWQSLVVQTTFVARRGGLPLMSRGLSTRRL